MTDAPARADVRTTVRWWLVGAALVAVGATALAPIAEVVTDGDIRAVDLLSDPAELTGEPWFLGGVSALNIAVWVAAATAYLVGGLGLRGRQPRLASTLLQLGGICALLALDDRFLLHEIAIPWILGAPEVATFAAYAGATGAVVWRGRHVLAAEPEVPLLWLAGAGVAASAGLDVLGSDLPGRRELEETCKMLGTVGAASFPIALVSRRLREPAPHRAAPVNAAPHADERASVDRVADDAAEGPPTGASTSGAGTRS